jgi:DNA ligase-1
MPRSGVMLATKLDYNRLLRWQPPYIVQPKYNGNRCRAVYKDGIVTLYSSESNVIVSVPHINKQLEEAFSSAVYKYQFEFDGELYCHGMSLQKIRSIVGRTVNLHNDYQVIEFHIFDIIDEHPQILRAQSLCNLGEIFNSSGKHIQFVPTYFSKHVDQIETYLRDFVEDGYEGIIVREAQAPYVRKRCTTMLKYKPRKSDTYRIVGTTEEISISGVPKDALGAFICEKDGQFFKVGTGPLLTREMREGLWAIKDDLIGKYAIIKYQELTERGVPFFPVIVEVFNETNEE